MVESFFGIMAIGYDDIIQEITQLTPAPQVTPPRRPSTRPRRRPSRSLGTPDPKRLGRYPDAIPVEVDVDKISRIQSAISSKLHLYNDAERKLLTKHCNNLHTLISERIDPDNDEENDDE